MALEDSISKELSYIPAYMGYDYVDMPDSVIMSKLSKYNVSFSSLKIDSIKLPNDVSMGEKMLPDSAKIELPGSGIVLSVYNDRKGLAILKAAPEIKYTLSRQETTEILKLIKQIFFVNRGKIIIAKRRLPYGGIIADFLPMIKSQIYYKGKEENDGIFSFKRELSYVGRHLLRCRVHNPKKGTITKIFCINGK